MRGGNTEARGDQDQKSILQPLRASGSSSSIVVRGPGPALRVGVTVARDSVCWWPRTLCAEGGRGGGSSSFHLSSRFCPGGQPGGVRGCPQPLPLSHKVWQSPLVPRYSTPGIPWLPLPSCPERPDFSLAGLAGPNPCLGVGFGAGWRMEGGEEEGPSKPPVPWGILD